ncbi:MAG TPA: peroxiredoxin [Phycisphaerales bacterium]|nr:peroxiredoxin [Phycisphaerales bacterium]HCD34273.1 peroxiredoxin [Phycisphaerales bacterium]|tara:strand:+ start:1332 stop:1802 length:471 start_codon:yes stop_codon:yes gene_type:complete
MSLTIGQPAPNFCLPNQDEKSISLGDLAGNWLVLYFYPKDDTPGCTIEACEFSEALKDLEHANAKVLGISADDPQSHRDFMVKYKLSIDLLSDTDMQMIKAYGVWGEKVRDGVAKMGIMRQTFLIDPDGKIAYHWPSVTPQGHAREVEAKLKELRD